jgi:hypothetical protein
MPVPASVGPPQRKEEWQNDVGNYFIFCWLPPSATRFVPQNESLRLPLIFPLLT